ncbi:MAG: hypothetical protein ABIP03_08065 [Aquihabitans sp.]
MLKMLVTATGIAGWGLGIWLIIHFRATERSDPPDLVTSSKRERFLVVVSRVAGSVTGALVAGLLTVGLGGRLMMRILAATSPASSQGRITEAEEVVGEVNAGGTVFLVLFVGLVGGLAGLALYSALRRWLPRRSVSAGLITVTIGAGLVARPTALLDPESPDFDILEPLWLAVPLILFLLATFGALGGVLIDRWAGQWPTPNSVKGGLALLPVIPALVFGPVGPLLVVVTLYGVFAAPAIRRSRSLPSIDRVGRIVTAIGTVAAWIWVLTAAGQILTA